MARDDFDPPGIAMRRRVLGDEYVDRALERTSDFDVEFQKFITEYAWGKVWTRPGLDPRTRSLLTIVMLAALGREEELRLHLLASQNAGATVIEVREALMQVAIYAGVPAANAAFRIAKEVFGQAAKDSK